MVIAPQEEHREEKDRDSHLLAGCGGPAVDDDERRKGYQRDARDHEQVRSERHEHHTRNAQSHEIVDALIDVLGELLAGHEGDRSEEHTSELQSLMRKSYAVFTLKKRKTSIEKSKKNTSMKD